MATIIDYSRKAILLILLSASFSMLSAQNSKKAKDSIKAETTKSQVEAKRFVFQAQSASPMRGGRRNLTPGYTLLVSNDTLVSDLPYFGRAYSAGYGTDGGIKFTSTKFESSVKSRKKEGWDLNIKPTDITNIEVLIITVHESGTASLQVKTRDRQPISFDGYIEEP
ncbi:MAG: DUF4251 domain-containing protein, partial [Chitinophagaceae bacterium]|nr:DUF4251 domain-containing protein [Chitinophagaceae bacterium]